ncbi:MAG TPA: 4Fe-4S dicluster domain-containing protein [Caldilineae bacterium]|nr:4Fe-4S dicluster domain-containing protein [Caldilineae bacterium]
MSDDTIKATRREFLKGAGAAALTVAGICSIPQMASAEGSSTGAHADPWAMLIDIARCQGCDSCALACKEANQLPLKENPPAKLDADTYTFVDRRQVTVANGEVETRYVKRQCMHCLNASCVSACPAAAMHKTEEGPVYYRANRCLGCRYCQIGCPFGVPQFDWNNGLTPEISKCWMCYERLQKGEQPACIEACPTGAIRFGPRSRMLAIAHARIDSNPGHYIDHVYGEHEVGGTAMLYISDVPFEQLGFPANLPTTAPPEETEKIMTKLPFVIGGLAVALSGTAAYTHRHSHETEITEE